MSITIICNQTYTCTRMREQEDENDYDVKKKTDTATVCGMSCQLRATYTLAAAVHNTVRVEFLCTCSCSNVANHVVIERLDRNCRSNALKTDCSSHTKKKFTQLKNIYIEKIYAFYDYCPYCWVLAMTHYITRYVSHNGIDLCITFHRHATHINANVPIFYFGHIVFFAQPKCVSF